MPLILTYKVNVQDNNQSLGAFLKKKELSRKAIIALKHRGGKICINWQEKTTRTMLCAEDVVSVIFPDEPVSNLLLPIKMPLHIVHEDDFLLVVDKKEGLPVVPSGNHRISLANGILAYYEKIGLKSAVHFVNRLDKDTSGLLVIAKYRHVHHLMTADISKLTRKYYALISGVIKTSGRVDAPIIKPSAPSIKRAIHPSGQRAITHYEIVQQFKDATLIKCILETGRTHQIRIHMSHLGHPILKDPLYGTGSEGDKQLLHSYFLEFIHPMTEEKMRFERPIPSRFEIDHLVPQTSPTIR